MRINPIIIHYHIFKNAGSSVDYSLKRMFGNAWTTYEGDHACDVLSSERLNDFINNYPEIMAISSHLARPPLPCENCLPILFLRHPILRAKSVYNFVKKDVTQPNHCKASTKSFCEYVEWALFEEPKEGGVVIKNYQVVHLSDASFRGTSILDATARLDDLRQAECLLLSWPAFGIVEAYEKSMALFQQCYGELIQGLQLSGAWLNKSSQKNQSHNVSVEAQLEAIHGELGDEVFTALCVANDLDLRLYHSSVIRFEEISSNLSACYL